MYSFLELLEDDSHSQLLIMLKGDSISLLSALYQMLIRVRSKVKFQPAYYGVVNSN